METTKKDSSHRQIQAAIVHFNEGDLDCAITLAAAAEGILAPTDEPHLFRDLRTSPNAQDIDLNLAINWLKYPDGPDEVQITEFEAAITIARAITKFIAAYHQSTLRFEQFLKRGYESGILPVRMHKISD